MPKKAKIKVAYQQSSGYYRVIELVNMATFSTPSGTLCMLGSDITPRDMEAVARDRRWDVTIVPAK